ncbi:uncharacterized protein HHUB_2416 [Halobacterium hubeiense]|uniref:Uncharacterized protein n=2 Tax=Halobacterium hubeiense TaxID=1407499 RepID=A0A0U5H306_9EURY|nr:uncharacterized protein HHUB_2416 [Halobacterium hubeiense]
MNYVARDERVGMVSAPSVRASASRADAWLQSHPFVWYLLFAAFLTAGRLLFGVVATGGTSTVTLTEGVLFGVGVAATYFLLERFV